ncbi:MAG: FAD-dependent oxidoreductase, partial [Thermoplasmata archaeon]|nr:FAD-dependent oxidoreductase [Thermoplasmata archaeon]
ELLEDRFNIDVRVFSEVIDIDRENKEIVVKDLKKGEEYRESYDVLVLCPGGSPIKPPLEGIDLDSVFSLWTIPDSDKIKSYVADNDPKSAVVIGGGFIGLEMAENLKYLGLDVTVVEMLDQVMPPLDFEMVSLVHQHIIDHGVHLHLSDAVSSFHKMGDKTVVKTKSGAELETDMVILSIGVRPNNELAKISGLDMGDRGGIKTNKNMLTSDPNIYAAGDVCEVTDFINRQPAMIPLAGPANKMGRIVADNIFGRASEYKDTQASAIVKIFDQTVALSGNNEKLLQRFNIPYLKSYTQSGSHAAYYPGAQMMNIKLLFSPDDGKLLGAQIVGMDGADKRLDVLATAIRAGMTVYDLEELELAYAPPFSSGKDPVNMAGFVASNILRGDVEMVYWDEIDVLLERENTVFIDVRDDDEVEMHRLLGGAIHIPLNELRNRLSELDKSKEYVAYCAMGLRGYIAYRMMKLNGFKVKNMSGGCTIYNAPRANLVVREIQPEKIVAFAEDCFDNFDHEINASGIPCPGPIMKLAKKIKTMENGEVLKITVSDVGFSRDVPGWCTKTGNLLVSITEDKGFYYALVMKGTEMPATAASPGTVEIPTPAKGAPDIVPDFEVNACGVPCPGPIMKLAKKIKVMETGQVLKISASDVGFSKDVPGWCAKTGHEMISMTSLKGIYTVLIRKG